MKKLLVPVLIGIVGLMPRLASANVYSFDFTGEGSATPLTLTSGALSATITGSGDPGGFQVVPSFFPGQPGYVLYTPGVFGQTDETLTITFNQAVQDFSAFFARDIDSPDGDFVLTAYADGTEVGTTSSAGTVVSTFPQGTITFSGQLFNEITLADDTAPNFAVASLSVDYQPGQQLSAVPEPASIGVFGTGIIAMALRRTRRKR